MLYELSVVKLPGTFILMNSRFSALRPYSFNTEAQWVFSLYASDFFVLRFYEYILQKLPLFGIIVLQQNDRKRLYYENMQKIFIPPSGCYAFPYGAFRSTFSSSSRAGNNQSGSSARRGNKYFLHIFIV